MLDAIRVIVQGHGNPAPAETTRAVLANYADTARARWQSLIDGLPDDDPARMPLGHYEIAFELIGVDPAGNLSELRRRMDMASST
ncbi:MAG: hypothetical protein QOE39_1457, partial [Bradyrhizobium sp.]|nr:hypothetical protein [Bradyrhizobium sp.]